MAVHEFPIKIINKRWKVRLLPDKKFDKKYGEDTAAIALCYKKQLIFRQDNLTLEDASHELTHAYLDELCLGNSLNLTKEQLEEAFCELMSKWGVQLLVQALYIRSKQKSLKG